MVSGTDAYSGEQRGGGGTKRGPRSSKGTLVVGLSPKLYTASIRRSNPLLFSPPFSLHLHAHAHVHAAECVGRTARQT